VAWGVKESEACSAAWHGDFERADVLRDAASLCSRANHTTDNQQSTRREFFQPDSSTIAALLFAASRSGLCTIQRQHSSRHHVVAWGVKEGEACSAAWHGDFKSANVLCDASSLCRMKQTAGERKEVVLLMCMSK
jgi:hypothetical protein